MGIVPPPGHLKKGSLDQQLLYANFVLQKRHEGFSGANLLYSHESHGCEPSEERMYLAANPDGKKLFYLDVRNKDEYTYKRS